MNKAENDDTCDATLGIAVLKYFCSYYTHTYSILDAFCDGFFLNISEYFSSSGENLRIRQSFRVKEILPFVKLQRLNSDFRKLILAFKTNLNLL